MRHQMPSHNPWYTEQPWETNGVSVPSVNGWGPSEPKSAGRQILGPTGQVIAEVNSPDKPFGFGRNVQQS